MGSITSNDFLDTTAGTRTAGETWTVSGATLTVRTDTRWHAKSPAGMTGSLGTLTVDNGAGGGFTLDATQVRWMAYNTGTGTVPAIGSIITQGGVSGYLLGVWLDYTSAPTAVGAAMPATGFIKFREVTGGTYSAGALTGIGANASSPDVTGWIEVVMDQSSNITLRTYATDAFVTRGGWFYLDSTTGSRGQIITVPTNGGGSGTNTWAVQIETSPGSDVYEWWFAIDAASFVTTGFTAADNRAKVLLNLGNGQIRIGQDGAAASVAALPAAGCKVRVPNIFGRTCTTTTRASNVSAGTRVTVANSSGRLDTEYLYTDWNLCLTNVPIKSIKIDNCAIEASIIVFNNGESSYIRNTAIGPGRMVSNNQLLTLDFCKFPVEITNVICGGVLSGGAVGNNNIRSSSNITINNLEVISLKTRTAGSPYLLNIFQCKDVTINGLKVRGAKVWFETNNTLTINNLDYMDGLGTTAISTNPVFASVELRNGNVNTVLNGYTVGNNGAYVGTHPFGLLFFVNDSGNGSVFIRNAGTRSAPLDMGASGALFPNQVVSATTSGPGPYKFQRLYVSGTRSSAVPTGGWQSSSNTTFESVFGTTTNSSQLGLSGTLFKGCGVTSSTTPTAYISGLHFADLFLSNTTGSVVLLCNPPNSDTQPYVTTSFSARGSGFNVGQGVSLDVSGEYVIYEMPYFAIGHTGFQNTPATFTGSSTGEMSYEYQIDTGSGWNGSWKIVNGANLSGETVSPSTGVKLKVKITATTGTTSKIIERVSIPTTSTLIAQSSNLYPLDTINVTLTGIQTNSEVRAYAGTDPTTSVEIGGIENSGASFTFSHSNTGESGYIQIFALGYQPITIPYTYKSTDDSILIQQTVDRNYNNP